jgi:hypothetical protein
MATKAERYAKGELKLENNEQLAAALADVIAVSNRNADAIRLELASGMTYDFDRKTTRPLQAEERKLREYELESSTHAYRYEVLDDDSVVEIRVDKAGAKPKVTALDMGLITSPAGAVAGGLGEPPPDDAHK